MKQYLKEAEVAAMVGLSVKTLRNARSNRRGIPFCKLGRSVRYSLDDVIHFVEANKVHTMAA